MIKGIFFIIILSCSQLWGQSIDKKFLLGTWETSHNIFAPEDVSSKAKSFRDGKLVQECTYYIHKGSLLAPKIITFNHDHYSYKNNLNNKVEKVNTKYTVQKDGIIVNHIQIRNAGYSYKIITKNKIKYRVPYSRGKEIVYYRIK